MFAYLADSTQFFWMRELARVLKPGGHLLLALHGKYYLPRLTAGEQRRFRSGRMVIRSTSSEGRNRCAAFHPESYVRDVLAGEFRVSEFVPEGALGSPSQEPYLLQKPGGTAC